ncbi:predicted protein [Plenodomus lingam JN3]|uniref:Predicted protein n=1 Tax=Leptosphaeria maculans (strain JN3 / isolate v23.1.3 / race Av1-4-5-6-7-8) TaxID=985895 RepID=E4ZTM1_LEPMJ|nr:predicted protein [Plenodomus lingam JN3]CBX94877.1 predicted protein [Plenodomus lingam JN3]
MSLLSLQIKTESLVFTQLKATHAISRQALCSVALASFDIGKATRATPLPRCRYQLVSVQDAKANTKLCPD